MFDYGTLQTELRTGPQCVVTVSNPYGVDSDISASVNAIVDTGAAMSCIPESIIRELGNLVRDDNLNMRDANGGIASKRTFIVELRIGGVNIPDDIRVVETTGKYILIGRDVLNHYKVVLDGRFGVWMLNCERSCTS